MKKTVTKSLPSSAFTPIETVLRDVRRGRLIVIVDDRQRENEGDLFVAAEKATSRSINFMARYGRGLICVALTAERLARLQLERLQSSHDPDHFDTAFMESVDARHGVTTGISAHDRARTVRVLIDDTSRPGDLVSPGHVFPLAARAGGVLRRAGHTEAACDLARLAGLKPAGVICEIMRDDGRMARLPDLIKYTRQHGLALTTVADLIAYRRRSEKLVTRVHSAHLPTRHGTFDLHLYESSLDSGLHMALVMGEPERDPAALARIHSECLTGDVLGSLRCDCGAQLQAAMQQVARNKSGVILYLRQEGRGIGLANKIHAYALQEKGLDTVAANKQLGFEADLRDYGTGAQILSDLGLKKIRLLTNNPRKVVGLEGYGIEIVEILPLILPKNPYNQRYLETKKKKLGHWL